MRIKDPNTGEIIPAMLLGPEIPDQVRIGLGWALFYPSEAQVLPTGKNGSYKIHVEGRGPVTPDISADMMRGLLLLRMLNPVPGNPNHAMGNPEFLAKNPEWRFYIPDPRRRPAAPPRR